MFNIREIKNFLSKEECLYIIDSINKINTWIKYPNDPFWNERVFDIYSLSNENKLKHMMSEKINDVKNIIKTEYYENDLYANVFEITRWYPGMSQQPHIDDETNKYLNNNPHAHRKYGAIVYLNENYLGGETYYPNQKLKIKPEVGKLIIHPGGGEEHLHGVTQINGSMRYTISSFWSRDQKYSNEY